MGVTKREQKVSKHSLQHFINHPGYWICGVRNNSPKFAHLSKIALPQDDSETFHGKTGLFNWGSLSPQVPGRIHPQQIAEKTTVWDPFFISLRILDSKAHVYCFTWKPGNHKQLCFSDMRRPGKTPRATKAKKSKSRKELDHMGCFPLPSNREKQESSSFKNFWLLLYPVIFLFNLQLLTNLLGGDNPPGSLIRVTCYQFIHVCFGCSFDVSEQTGTWDEDHRHNKDLLVGWLEN